MTVATSPNDRPVFLQKLPPGRTMYGIISLGNPFPEPGKCKDVSSWPESISSFEPGRRFGPAAGPSASIAIFELQKIVPSGNLRIALQLLGSFFAFVRSKSSNISLFSCATSTASAKGTPSHCAAEAEGGLNEDMWSTFLLVLIEQKRE